MRLILSVPPGNTRWNQGPLLTPRVSPFGWIGEAWGLLRTRFGLWLLLGMIVFVTAFASVIAIALFNAPSDSGGSASASDQSFDSSDYYSIALFIAMVSPFVAALLSGFALPLALRQASGERIGLRDIFRRSPHFGRLLLFWIIQSVFVGIGLLFCIVPGLLLLGLTLPVPALVADGEGIFSAYSRSLDWMGQRWPIALLLGIGMTVLWLAGVATWGLGFLVILPLLWLLPTVAYRQLSRAERIPHDYGIAQEGVWPPPPTFGPTSSDQN